ncbi:MAG: tetratricopeptide repeat protein [Verrucomicrobia bacterium]|nr:tetratricopeptide repeat protein [Verrucomicrobiota bacterium]
MLALVTVVTYLPALRGPFIFDDASAILENPTIRHGWPFAEALHPPPNSTVAGRPLLNLSFAFCHAVSGLNPFGYHVFNLLAHVLAGLALFGLVRRTLLLPGLRAHFEASALPTSFGVAAVWLLHPVQTAAVTYISQRSEVMMGLFYLLALYAYLRSTEAGRYLAWGAIAVASALLGVMSKEAALTLPFSALLFDRTFLSGSFSEAWRKRRGLLVALTSTWIITVLQLSTLKDHGVGVGPGQSPFRYLASECEVIIRYVGLALWPKTLVFDYGENLGFSPAAVSASTIALVLIGAASGYALWRKPGLGLLAVTFFALLAPTSSFVPIVHQPMAENRLYLPLAPVAAIIVVALVRTVDRRVFFAVLAPVLLTLAALTVVRNRDFQDEIGLWQDTVQKSPGNARAHYNLGHALAQSGQDAEAVPAYERAIALRPDYAEAQHNLANSLARLGGKIDAVKHYEAALRLHPDYPAAHYDLAVTQAELGNVDEAIRHFRAALEFEPGNAVIHCRLAEVLAQRRRFAEAFEHYREATERQPNFPEAFTNWGNALVRNARGSDAIEKYQRALKCDPNYVEAHINLGNALYALQRVNEAVEEFEIAVRLAPRSAAARYNLGNLELARGRLPEAIRLFERAIDLDPALAGAHHNLALALVRSGRTAEALSHYQETLRLVPDSAAAHHNLAIALGQLGRFAEAATHEEAALRLQPDFPEARDHLDWLRRRLPAAPK